MELKIRRAQRPLTERWAALPVEPAGPTLLGVSFRPLQAQALGLAPRETLTQLLQLLSQLQAPGTLRFI